MSTLSKVNFCRKMFFMLLRIYIPILSFSYIPLVKDFSWPVALCTREDFKMITKLFFQFRYPTIYGLISSLIKLLTWFNWLNQFNLFTNSQYAVRCIIQVYNIPYARIQCSESGRRFVKKNWLTFWSNLAKKELFCLVWKI